jgi:hypothetical protein
MSLLQCERCRKEIPELAPVPFCSKECSTISHLQKQLTEVQSDYELLLESKAALLTVALSLEAQLTEAKEQFKRDKEYWGKYKIGYYRELERAEKAEQELEDVLAMLEYHSSGAESASFALEKIEQALKKEVE